MKPANGGFIFRKKDGTNKSIKDVLLFILTFPVLSVNDGSGKKAILTRVNGCPTGLPLHILGLTKLKFKSKFH